MDTPEKAQENQIQAPAPVEKNSHKSSNTNVNKTKKRALLPKHKLFCDRVVRRTIENREPILAGAYKEVYTDLQNPKSAYVNGSKLFKKEHIRAEVERCLLDSGLTMQYLFNRLHRLIESENEGISLSALQTGFKLADAYPSENGAQIANIDNLEVTINVNRTVPTLEKVDK